MKRLYAFIALSCLALCACRTEEAEGSAETGVTSRIYPSDEDIMAMAYDPDYNAPGTFLVDARATTEGSYTIYHVKDVSLSYELCTDDYVDALAWESADNESRAVNGIYVDLYENDRYFEIVRELSYPDSIGNITDVTSPGFSRVFKCSYVNRGGVDRHLRNGYAGTLNIRPLSEEVIKTYSEYMWQFTFFWPARKKVLESFSNETTDAYEHTLTLVFITNQGSEKCDLVEVVDWVFSVDKNDGQVTKNFRLLFEFSAQLVDGAPQKCDS